ncbi:MAG: spore coat associated protein CotJA [Eubacterium sp.]
MGYNTSNCVSSCRPCSRGYMYGDKLSQQYSSPCEANDSMAIGMAYVPWQQWSNVYEIEKGFCIGTIFPDLNKPFLGRAIR